MFAVLDLITAFIYGIFGDGLVFTLVIFSVLILMLLAMRVHISVTLAILIPLAIGFVLNTPGSEVIQIVTWIVIALLLMAGFFFSLLFLYFQR